MHNTWSAGPLAIVLAIGLPLHAQEVIIISGEPSCSACLIQVDRLVTIDGRSEPSLLGQTAELLHTSGGTWILTAAFDGILEYSNAGEFVRQVGRRGEGPGEFRSAGKMYLGPDDSIYVYDHSLRRRAIYTPTLEFVRNEPTSARSIARAQALPGSGYLLNAQATARGSRQPFLIFDRNGRLVRAFGNTDTLAQLDQPDLYRRRIGPIRDGRFWSAHRTRYRLEQWDTAGSLFRVLERSPEWYQPHGRASISATEPPPPRTGHIYTDPDGLIWVAINVPDARWRTSISCETMPQFGLQSCLPQVWDRYFDTIIEVIDPATERIVTSRRFDERVHDVNSEGEWVYVHESPEGHPILEVWRLRLSGYN